MVSEVKWILVLKGQDICRGLWTCDERLRSEECLIVRVLMVVLKRVLVIPEEDTVRLGMKKDCKE